MTSRVVTLGNDPCPTPRCTGPRLALLAPAGERSVRRTNGALSVKVNLTDVVAWWGAVVATIVLLWDVYKWTHRGADVRVEAAPNMKVFPKLPHTGDTNYI